MIEETKRKNALKMAMHGSGANSSGTPLEPCKHFWQGKCMRAKSDTTCNFAHGTRADAKRILCRHHQIRGACRYGDKCHYATQAEYDALDWDAKVPLDAEGPHRAPTPAASPTVPQAEGAGANRRSKPAGTRVMQTCRSATPPHGGGRKCSGRSRERVAPATAVRPRTRGSTV